MKALLMLSLLRGATQVQSRKNRAALLLHEAGIASSIQVRDCLVTVNI